MLLSVLSYLLFLANRGYRSERFYQVKSSILSRYGKVIGTDYQFIEGKICYTCAGTSTAVDWDGNECRCNRCINGWFKQARWVQLLHYQFGKFTFHLPNGIFFEKPPGEYKTLYGLIVKKSFRSTKFAQKILHILYEKGYLKGQISQLGSMYNSGFHPVNNLVHLFRYGKRSTQVHHLKMYVFSILKPKGQYNNSDLPF